MAGFRALDSDTSSGTRPCGWYMTARLITVHDIYSFDPNAVVSIEPFVDIVGRHFRQPEEGLGWDNSPSSHMWRTIRRPTKYL